MTAPEYHAVVFRYPIGAKVRLPLGRGCGEVVCQRVTMRQLLPAVMEYGVLDAVGELYWEYELDLLPWAEEEPC